MNQTIRVTRNLGLATAFLATLVLFGGAAWAQGKAALAKEVAEQLIRRFSKEVADEGVEKLTARVQSVMASAGDDVFKVIEKGGPRALRILEGSGADGAISARLLSKYGDEAIGALESPVRLGMVREFGEEAGEALIKHGVVAEKLIASAGSPAVGAMKQLTDQSVRRMAMLADEPSTAALAKSSDLLGVVGRYGDRAMDFVWRNKLTLAGGTALAAFVANPEPFLDGTRQLVENTVESVATNVGKPIAQQLGDAKQWTWRILAIAAMLILFWGWKTRGSRRSPKA
ncbi:MAG: hypothetical protein KGS49_08695 [Planctomycetes bacterium]|nr:hypothetical protein [Planctomycetota bacterium]